MPLSSRMEANVFGVRSFQAMGCLLYEMDARSAGVGSGSVQGRARGYPAAFACRKVSRGPRRSHRGATWRVAVGTRDPAGPDRIEQRARTRAAHRARRVVAPAARERVA